MVKITTSRSLKLYVILLLLTSFVGCANQLPPGGGNIDTTPPEIIETYPQNGTTNYNKDYFEINFSEYVDKNSFQNALFISPAIEGTFDYDWSGKTVRVTFPQQLKNNLTYVITIGTEVQDLNNRNKMAQAVSFAFSTGSKIDKGTIEGKIFADEPSGSMLFAYMINDSIPNPDKRKPDYISQAGINGEYIIPGLANSNYRVYAVKEEFSNLVYDIGEDNIGVPFADVLVDDTDTSSYGLNFFMFKEDTAKPRLKTASMTDNRHILLEFNEPFDSSIIRSNNFHIYDSTAGKQILPVYAFKGRGKPEQMVLAVRDTINNQNSVYLFADKVIDKKGNLMTNDFASLVVSTKADTISPVLLGVKNLPVDNKIELEQPEFLFPYDDGFDSTLVQKGIEVLDSKKNILPFKSHFYDDATFGVKILQTLKPNSQYIININLRNLIDIAGNKKDTVYKYQFKTSGGLDYTGASGKVKGDLNGSKNLIVVLKNADKSKPSYSKPINNKMEFDFKRVDPGKYLLWGYFDDDSSKTYTYGTPFPFKPSEKFFFYPDTLNLRARWPVGDIELQYNKNSKGNVKNKK